MTTDALVIQLVPIWTLLSMNKQEQA